MRRPHHLMMVFAFLVTLVPIQVMAQGLVVSGFGCRQTLPCDGSDLKFPHTDKLIADTALCVTRNVAVMPETPVFDEIAGLDGGGCLTTNPDAFPLGRSTAAPHCCVRQMPSGSCVMHCDVVTQ